MARPRMGIFSALFALGGVLAWQWSKKQRASSTLVSRELTRWEGEGGTAAATPAAADAVRDETTKPWPFPHGEDAELPH